MSQFIISVAAVLLTLVGPGVARAACVSNDTIGVHNWGRADMSWVDSFANDATWLAKNLPGVEPVFAARCLVFDEGVKPRSKYPVVEADFRAGTTPISEIFEILESTMSPGGDQPSDPVLVYQNNHSFRVVIGRLPEGATKPEPEHLIGKQLVVSSCTPGDLTDYPTTKVGDERVSASTEATIEAVRQLLPGTPIVCQSKDATTAPDAVNVVSNSRFTAGRIAAFRSGEADFVQASIPGALELLEEGFVMYIGPEIVPDVPVSATMVRRDFLTSDVLVRYLAAKTAAREIVVAHQEAAARWLAETTLAAEDNQSLAELLVLNADGTKNVEKTLARATKMVEFWLENSTPAGCFDQAGLEQYQKIMFLGDRQFFSGTICKQ